MDFENEMSMWSVEIFIMSLDSSCDLLVYMTNEYSSFFCIMNRLF